MMSGAGDAGRGRRTVLVCFVRDVRGGSTRAIAVALLMGWSAARCVAATQTTTTTYQYNADGALTAVTTRVDGHAPSTAYLTWDDFVPAAGNPSTGTVLAGNGNLVGVGPTPGGAFATAFQYDPRNRLLTATDSAGSVAYSYYPASLMAASTLADGDTRQFYYGVSAIPQVTNLMQPASGTWASYLGDATYLSDGTEQVLCKPRKDIAGVYDPLRARFSADRYEPYGASTAGSAGEQVDTGSAYDLRQNPFLYADEYRDPTWGGYYLRGRWYLPALQTFNGRDPVDGLHRYGYGGGNPIGNADPSGFSYKSFSRDIDRRFRPLTGGIAGYITPLIPIVGQVVGGATLIANLPRVWHHPTADEIANFAFLGASVAAEGFGELRVVDRVAGSAANALYARGVMDVAVGSGQAVFSSYHGGKWDVSSLVQSMEYNAGGMFSARVVSGFGYRPHTLTAEDVGELTRRHFAGAADQNGALIFRVRSRLAQYIPSFTSPLLESATLGIYHEGVLGISSGKFLYADVASSLMSDGKGGEVRAVSGSWLNGSLEKSTFETLWGRVSQASRREPTYQFELVGRFDKADVGAALTDPRAQGYPSYTEQRDAVRRGAPIATPYNIVTWNCHDYAQGILGRLTQANE